MALFAISDLHLSFGTDKPMDVFGSRWENYEKKLEENWNRDVSPEDVVIVNGDNSWAMYLEDTYEDFKFINSLNGTKLLLKGNHDYWWSTMSKHEKWCRKNGFDTIKFIHNNHYLYGGTAICGTRGWQLTDRSAEDIKVYNRERERLINSLKSAAGAKNIIAALHYPPDDGFKSVLCEYGVSFCVFGHLHAGGFKDYSDFEENGIPYRLVSCDYLGFEPYKIIT